MIRSTLSWLKRRRPRLARPVILMYHRIASPARDPWGLSVSPDLFREHLQALKRHRTVLAMDDFVERLCNHSLPARAVAITFDDGYVDNFRVAKPLLEEIGLPATIFLTTGSLGGGSFWWDRLAEMVMTYPEPLRRSIEIDGIRLELDLPPIGLDSVGPPLPTIMGPRASARERSYFALWQALQPADPVRRASELVALEALFGSPPEMPHDSPMSHKQAKDLASGWISVGGHAREHHPLPALSAERQRAEIEGSMADCATLIGKRPRGFAYPHGERTAQTRQLVEQAGFAWAVSTQEATVNRRDHDLYDLPRLGVGPWTGKELLQRLRQLPN
jgi:peptidoglycan/xylan/chitin deacetylase (PgdA/CDA1 family)